MPAADNGGCRPFGEPRIALLDEGYAYSSAGQLVRHYIQSRRRLQSRLVREWWVVPLPRVHAAPAHLRIVLRY